MTIELIPLTVGIITLALGSMLGYFVRQSIAKHQRGTAEEQVTKIISNAKTEASNIVIAARDKSAKFLEEAKKEEQELKKDFIQREKRIFEKEGLVEKKNTELDGEEKKLQEKGERLKEIKKEIDALLLLLSTEVTKEEDDFGFESESKKKEYL